MELEDKLEATSKQEEDVKEEAVSIDNKVSASEGPSHLLHKMRNLNTFYNPTLQGLQDVRDVVCLTTAVDSNAEEPQTFQQAWNYPDKYECEGWRCRIQKV